MRFALILAAGLLSGASGALAAQAPQGTALGSVRVAVRDVTGLPLAGAVVALTPAAGPVVTASTNDRGEALFEKVSQGSYSARVETAGFAPVDRPNVTVRGGRRTDVSVELQLAGIEEQVEVVPEPADEPFTSVLTAEQIQSLPDDPTELAQVLEQLVGATDLDIRVNGFSGGELPAGGRIQEVRVRWDGGADGRGEGPRVEIRTQPGSDGWRNRVNFGLRDERQIIGKTDLDLHPRGHADKYRVDDLRVMASGKPMLNIIELFLDLQGIPTWHVTNKMPVFSHAGRVIGVMGTIETYEARRTLGLTNKAMLQAYEHIRTHFSEEVSVRDLAAQCGLSVRQFERNRCADAARRAGDQGDLPFEFGNAHKSIGGLAPFSRRAVVGCPRESPGRTPTRLRVRGRCA